MSNSISRSRALSAPIVRTTGQHPSQLQQQQPKQSENVIPLIVKEASDKFRQLPKQKRSDAQKRSVAGNKKRQAYGNRPRAGQNATSNLRAFGKTVYGEIFDVGRPSSSEDDDTVTAVGDLHTGRLSLVPVDRDKEDLTDEQQQQVAETFEQLGELADAVEGMFAQEMKKLRTLDLEDQQRVLVSVKGLLDRCHGKEAGDPQVAALLKAIHQIALEDGAVPSFDIPSDRIKHMMHPAMQMAELKHLQDIISDPSFNADDPAWKKFFLRWPLNFVVSFATVGLTVLLWTIVRSLIGNFIKSGFPDIAAATGMNATENWNVTDPGDPQARNSTSPGISTLPPQHQGGTAWGAATAAMVMIPQLFNLAALVRDGRNGSAQGHVQVSRLVQFTLCVAALSIGFSMPATGGQGLAAAYTVATFADVLKGLLYSVGRDGFNYFWPKVRPNAETLTVKAVIQDASVYFVGQTMFGLIAGYLAGVNANIPVNLPFFGGLDGGDLAVLGTTAFVNSVVETIDEISLAYFMRDEDKKQFIKNLMEQNKEGIQKINDRKAEFIKQRLPRILAARNRMVQTYDGDISDQWVDDLETLSAEDLKQLEQDWEKEARHYVKEHLTGLAMKFPTWEQTKAKVSDRKRLVDFLFKGRLATNRAAAMATAFFFSGTVLDAMAHPEDPTFDGAAQAVAAAATIIAVYVPGILACNRRGFANPKPEEMTRWQAIKYFMGFLTTKDLKTEANAELESVGSEDEIHDDSTTVSDPPPPRTIPGSPPKSTASE